MEILKQKSLYNKLTPNFREQLCKLVKQRTVFRYYTIFEWSCWIISIILILRSYNSFNDASKTLNIMLIFIIAGGLILTADKIVKEGKKNYTKVKDKVRNDLLFDICTCNSRCNCRQELKNFMEGNHIDLFKD